jgi:hypothetical protein
VFTTHYNYNVLMGEYSLQEGFARLWRGTNAGLALAVPTVSSSFMHRLFFGGEGERGGGIKGIA